MIAGRLSLRASEIVKRSRKLLAILPSAGDQITDLLLSDEQTELVTQVFRLAKTFSRTSAQSEERPADLSEAEDLMFHSKEILDLFFAILEYPGEADFASRRIQFDGDINNLSDSPRLLGEPVTFDIRGSGELKLVVTGTIDRRGPRPIDTIQLRLPSLPVPEKSLGHSETMLVNMKPSKMSVQLNARITGEALTGTIQVRQSNVRLQVAQLHPEVGGPQLAAQLSSQLAPVNSFEMTIDLGRKFGATHGKA